MTPGCVLLTRQFDGSPKLKPRLTMNEHTLKELRDALSTLRTDIAIALSWEALHCWFGVAPLDLPHYEQINHQWSQTWHQAVENCPAPTVHLYHGVEKLTLVRETTPDDPPAIALYDLASVVSKIDG
jgi:hypothetical protein